MENTGQYAYGTSGADIKASDAWRVSKGNYGIPIAVLDTGIDYNHNDLVSNMWWNTPECNGISGVDDDGNGFVDDCAGWNFVTCEEFADFSDNWGETFTVPSRKPKIMTLWMITATAPMWRGLSAQ